MNGGVSHGFNCLLPEKSQPRFLTVVGAIQTSPAIFLSTAPDSVGCSPFILLEKNWKSLSRSEKTVGAYTAQAHGNHQSDSSDFGAELF